MKHTTFGPSALALLMTLPSWVAQAMDSTEPPEAIQLKTTMAVSALPDRGRSASEGLRFSVLEAELPALSAQARPAGSPRVFKPKTGQRLVGRIGHRGEVVGFNGKAMEAER